MNDFNNNFPDNENRENIQDNNFSPQGINTLPDDNNNFKRKKHNKFLKLKKKAVFKIAVLILGAVILGNAVGFGIGFYSPKIESYFSQVKATSDSLSENVSDNEEAESSNPIVNASKSVVSIMAVSDAFSANPFEESEEPNTMGSGIIFYQTNKNVYIVTNYHVIANAKSVNISFNNEDFVSSSLVGKHQLFDLAVISVSRESLKKIGVNSVKTAYFGDSDKLNVGDSVIAIGNASGSGNTATRGIISAVQKEIPLSNGSSLNVIQTDTAINMGNDGGALIDKTGEVIGINTAKYSSSNVEGISFSISSNIAKPIIEEIMNKTDSPYLGVSVRAITEDIAQDNDLPQMGVIVESVVPGSSADEAGIKASDIITGFNSEPVFSPVYLTEAVRKCHVGDNVEIKIIRNGRKNITLNAILKQDTQNNF